MSLQNENISVPKLCLEKPWLIKIGNILNTLWVPLSISYIQSNKTRYHNNCALLRLSVVHIIYNYMIYVVHQVLILSFCLMKSMMI